MAPRLRVTWGAGDSTFDDSVRVHIGSGSRCQVRIDSLSVDEAVVIEPVAEQWVIRVRPGVVVSSSDSGVLTPGATVAFTEAINLTIGAEKISLIPESAAGASRPPRVVATAAKSNSIQVQTDEGVQELAPGSYTVGRATGADVRVQASDIGREHANLGFNDGRWWFADQSKNGSFINGQRLTEPVQVNGTLQVSLGSPSGKLVQLRTTQQAATQDLPAATAAAPSVVQHDRLELELDRSQLQITPGTDEAVEFVLQAQNRHPTEVLTVQLRAASVDGDPAWLSFGGVAGLGTGEVHLQPNGGTAQVVCRLTVPRAPTSRPGVYSFTIEGTEGTGTPKAVNVAVRVMPFLEVLVETPPTRKTKSRRSRPQKRPITFSNASNVPVQILVPHADEAEQLLIGGDQMTLQLGAGERSTVNAMLSLAEKPSFFERRELPYRISGRVEASDVLTDDWEFNGSYLKRPIVPLWMLVALIPLVTLLLVLAMSLNWWPFEEDDVFSMPEISTTTSRDLALQQIAERVPCRIVDPAIGTAGGRCVVTVVKEASAQEPGTIVRAEPTGGHVFADPNNMVIKLFEAEPLPVLPIAGTYTGASLERAIALIRQNIIDPPQYAVTADQIFVTVNHPETPIDRVNLANLFPCEPICDAVVTDQSLPPNTPIDQGESVEITLTVQDLDEPTPLPEPVDEPTPEPLEEPTPEPTEEPTPEPTPVIRTPFPVTVPPLITVPPILTVPSAIALPDEVILQLPPAFPAPAPLPTAQAYVWANQPSAAEYEGITGYSFPDDQPPIIRRTSEGRYTVTFPGTSTTGGNVQVVAYGSPALCSVVSWGGTSLNVRCIKPQSGDAVDSRFTARRVHFDKDAYAYVSTAGTNSEPTGRWTNNPSRGAVKVTRLTTGRYDVTFEGTNLGGGNVQVTPYGSTDLCYVVSFGGDRVRVECVDPTNGSLTDSRFSLIHSTSGAHVASSVTGGTPTVFASDNPANGNVEVIRLSAGRYQANFSGYSMNAGSVSVTALGPANCIVDGWSSSRINVSCRNFSGDPTDVGVSIVHHK